MFVPETPPRSLSRRISDRIHQVLYWLRIKRRPFTSYQMPIVEQPFPSAPVTSHADLVTFDEQPTLDIEKLRQFDGPDGPPKA